MKITLPSKESYSKAARNFRELCWILLALASHIFLVIAFPGALACVALALFARSDRALLPLALILLLVVPAFFLGKRSLSRAKALSAAPDAISVPGAYAVSVFLLLILLLVPPFSEYSRGFISPFPQTRFSLWVKVVDQDGNPIGKYPVQSSIEDNNVFSMLLGSLSWRNTQHTRPLENTLTDDFGMARISSGWKRGYLLTLRNSNPYLHPSAGPISGQTFLKYRPLGIPSDYRSREVGTVANPVLFRVHRIKDSCAQLLRYTAHASQYGQGYGISMDVARGELVATEDPQLEFFFRLESGNPDQAELLPATTLVIRAAPGSGVQMARDEFYVEAPVAGYLPEVRVHLREEWPGIGEQTEYIYFDSKQHGIWGRFRVEIPLVPVGDKAGKAYGTDFTIECSANPKGSRNLLPCNYPTTAYALPLELPITEDSLDFTSDQQTFTRAPSLERALPGKPSSVSFLASSPEKAAEGSVVCILESYGPAESQAQGLRRTLPNGYLAFEGLPEVEGAPVGNLPKVIILKSRDEIDVLRYARKMSPDAPVARPEVLKVITRWNTLCGTRIVSALPGKVKLEILHPSDQADSIFQEMRNICPGQTYFEGPQGLRSFIANLKSARPLQPEPLVLEWKSSALPQRP